jgi:hypothetical protein
MARLWKLSVWVVPTPNNYLRRLEIGPDGMICAGEAGFPFSVGKMARFDLEPETF